MVAGGKELDNRTSGNKVQSKKKFDKTTRNKFIRALKRTGNVKASAAHAGVAESTIYKHMKEEPQFKERVEQAKEECLHAVESEIYRRGVEGWSEPVYYQGEQIGEKVNYDSNLLIHLARTLAPERHAQKQQVEVNHSGEVSVKAQSKLASLLGIEESEDIEDADYKDITDQEKD